MILDFYQLYLIKILAVVVENKHTFLVYAEKNKKISSACRCKVVLGQNGLYVRSNCRGFRCVIIRDEHPLRGI